MRTSISFNKILIEWLAHWKSLTLLIVLATVLMASNAFFSHETTAIVEDVQNVDTLSAAEKEAVDEFIVFESTYNDVFGEYKLNRKYYSIDEKASVGTKVIEMKMALKNVRASLSQDQLAYYELVTGSHDIATNNNATENVASEQRPNYIGALFIVVLFHLLFITIGVSTNPKIQYDDELSNEFGVEELSLITIKNQDRKKLLLDRLIQSKKFRDIDEYQVNYKNSQIINIKRICDFINERELKSILIVAYDDATSYCYELTKSLADKLPNVDADVISADKKWNDGVVNYESVLFVVKSNITHRDEVRKNIQLFKAINIPIVGVIKVVDIVQ